MRIQIRKAFSTIVYHTGFDGTASRRHTRVVDMPVCTNVASLGLAMPVTLFEPNGGLWEMNHIRIVTATISRRRRDLQRRATMIVDSFDS